VWQFILEILCKRGKKKEQLIRTRSKQADEAVKLCHDIIATLDSMKSVEEAQNSHRLRIRQRRKKRSEMNVNRKAEKHTWQKV
jgi:hypothetical protein